MSSNSNQSPRPQQTRLLPRNGRFHAIRLGQRRGWREDPYVRLLETRWKWLFAGIAALYLGVNVFFALAYCITGGIDNANSFTDLFFFSVQTMATIGYGKMVPSSVMANVLVTVEAFTGFAYFATAAGLVFAKFSRPTARVLFSDKAVICPYNGVPHLMLRLANQRGNRIVDANIQLTILRDEKTLEGQRMRRFRDLTPVRDKVPVLQLTWTVMHLIDEKSPLYQVTPQSLRDSNAELIVSLKGLDETLSQTIHTRYSYIEEEIFCSAVFVDVLHRNKDGQTEVDYRLFHEVRPLEASKT